MPSVEIARHDAAVQVACAPVERGGSSSTSPISLYDLLEALQVGTYGNLILQKLQEAAFAQGLSRSFLGLR
jgi:hypothetical protein